MEARRANAPRGMEEQHAVARESDQINSQKSEPERKFVTFEFILCCIFYGTAGEGY